jgi:hypothetical protein
MRAAPKALQNRITRASARSFASEYNPSVPGEERPRAETDTTSLNTRPLPEIAN